MSANRAIETPGQSATVDCPFFLPESPKPQRLSRREVEALTLAARGLTNGEIAEKLLLGVRTVDRYIGSAMIKLNAPNRTCAVVIALNWQFIRFDTILAN
jgi:DNA-binding NarL/FixJ family response regulator